VAWTNVDFQMRFMNRHMPASLKAQLNRAGSAVSAAKLFMDEWERPGVEAFGDRADGARVAWADLTSRRDAATARARKQLRRAGKLRGRIKDAGGTSRAGRRQAKRAWRAAKRGMGAARRFNFDRARAQTKKSRILVGRGHRSVTRFNQSQHGAQHGSPGRRPGETPRGPGSKGMPGLFKGLPPEIRRQLEPGISTPNLTWQQKRDILDNALGIAETTTGIDDDRTVYDAIITAERGRRGRARTTLREENRNLRGFSAAGIAARRKENREIEKKLRSKKLGKAARDRLRKKQRVNNQRIREYEKSTGRRDRALDTINESDSAIRDAKSSRRDLTDGAGGTGSDLAEELKALRDEIAKQTAAMERGFNADAATLRQLLTDTMSGQIAGRADPVGSYGFSPAVNF